MFIYISLVCRHYKWNKHKPKLFVFRFSDYPSEGLDDVYDAFLWVKKATKSKAGTSMPSVRTLALVRIWHFSPPCLSQLIFSLLSNTDIFPSMCCISAGDGVPKYSRKTASKSSATCLDLDTLFTKTIPLLTERFRGVPSSL